MFKTVFGQGSHALKKCFIVATTLYFRNIYKNDSDKKQHALLETIWSPQCAMLWLGRLIINLYNSLYVNLEFSATCMLWKVIIHISFKHSLFRFKVFL